MLYNHDGIDRWDSCLFRRTLRVVLALVETIAAEKEISAF
jgi:hypothetical protein